MKLAIPSETPDGLFSLRSAHFGHAPYFTVVTVEDGEVVGVEAVKNVEHDESGCAGVIQHALTLGIDVLITIGMGRPPLARFTEAGVKVYSERATPDVGTVVSRFLRGECDLMAPDDACAH